MPSKLPFYKQEEPYSCVPACLRMVLAAKGYMMSELALRECCNCTFLGTNALKAIDALQIMGFSKSSKGTLLLPELIEELKAGLYPIVFVNMLPIDGFNDSHAMVVTAINDESVNLCDPLQGQRLLPRSTFDAAWAMMRNLAILVRD
jgi:ABC-type bacteriocin/lantibiotic exporter with double-glycine peptidase domain